MRHQNFGCPMTAHGLMPTLISKYRMLLPHTSDSVPIEPEMCKHYVSRPCQKAAIGKPPTSHMGNQSSISGLGLPHTQCQDMFARGQLIVGSSVTDDRAVAGRGPCNYRIAVVEQNGDVVKD